MSSNLRSSFKVKDPAKASKVLEDAQKLEKKIESEKYQNNRTKFISLKEQGSIICKIMPPHESSDVAPYYRTSSTVWLEIPVEAEDEKGEKIIDPKTRKPKIDIQKRSVFNGRIHGGLSKDAVELYIKYATEKINEDEDTRAENLEILNGNYATKTQGLSFINNSIVYIALIDKDDPFRKQGPIHLLTLNKSMKKDMLMLAESDDDEPASSDIFSDVDEGNAVKFKVKDENGRISYHVNTWSSKATKNSSIVPTTDEVLNEFSKLDSLTNLYVNSYSMRDFDLALSGLKYFDKKNKFGVFNIEEFTDELESLKAEIIKYEKSKPLAKATVSKPKKDEPEYPTNKSSKRTYKDEDPEEEEDDDDKVKKPSRFESSEDDDEKEDVKNIISKRKSMRATLELEDENDLPY